VLTLFFLWIAAIGVRTGYLQIYKSEWLSKKAADQYEQELILKGKRGTIYDCNHEAMAVSIETTSIAAYPGMIENKSRTASNLARILNRKQATLLKALNSKRSFVWLKRKATPNQVAAVRQLKIKGIDFLPEHSRFYPGTSLAAQLLGFTGIDDNGLEGLELYYEKQLAGSETKVTILKDALGRGFDVDRWSALNQAGNNIILTIDRKVQYFAEKALAETVTAHRARSGMALVMVPRTGALLAMAHYPFFNPNAYNKSDHTIWRNRAIRDSFEPGSTMKIFSAAAALESGKTTASSIFYCEKGNYLVGDHTVHDSKPHEWLSVQQIIKYSSNIGTIKMIEKVGPRTLYDQLRNFGFGENTGIDCPGELSGYLSHYKHWTAVDTGTIAFGQGVSATALRLITSAAAVANDGVLMRPYVVEAITSPEGKVLKKIDPKPIGRAVSAETAQTVRRIMRSVITDGGTGEKAEVDGYSVCGKTGTAQKIGSEGKYAKNLYVASFLGFAPTDRPAIAVLVVVDEPKGTYYGGLVAAPAFRQIVKDTLGYLNVPPEQNWKKLQVSREVKNKG
jgi:cell division protein FtsI (penicillin-binding protein 3)